MKRLAAAMVLALVLAGSAGADIFRVVPTTPMATTFLPSASVPNSQIAFPDTLLSRPLVEQTRSYDQLLALWQRAGASYHVPWQVLAAINKVESNFGRNMGPSSAGAIGWMQFMPSTWERWGVDANGDGIADPWNPDDAVMSAARYLAASGGETDISRAIFSYNHAQWYVDEVLNLSHLFGNGGVDMTFSLDRLQISLDQARAKVVRASRRLVAAQRHARKLAKRQDAFQDRAAATNLLSDRFAFDRSAVQTSIDRAAAKARVDELRKALDEAETALAAARDRSYSSAFSPAAGSLLGAPSYDAGYVFPVGGGPSLVSVSHHHHDYPAADIAAPAGSPIYALSDGVILRSWTYPNGNCGIGLTMQTVDGQTWTYCHMSYLDPTYAAGVHFAGGSQLGLVGQTGHATGPHLHLQLDPTTSYPQEQSWFQGFANVAFRWQDAGDDAVDGPAQPKVFSVVPQTAPSQGPVVLFTR